MRWLVALLAVLAFRLGVTLAEPESPVKTAATLLQRQVELFQDFAKIEAAAKDIKELRAQAEEGKYAFNDEEKALEKSAKMDFHIFMERIRNNTLEVLAHYDRVLGKELYIDPLRKVFGKALYENVEVRWDEKGMDEIVDQIVEGYGVKIYIKGNINQKATMSLQGEMTLLAILLQIENVFDTKLVQKDGALWFVKVGATEAEKDPEED